MDGDVEAGRPIACQSDATAINVAVPLLVDAGGSFVAASHEEDLAVNAYTVRRWTAFRDLAATGVDGVIADYPCLEAAPGGNGRARSKSEGDRANSSVDDGLLDDL